MDFQVGQHSIIGENVKIGHGAIIGHHCVIEDYAVLGENVRVDHNTIIRSRTEIGHDSVIGAGCTIGEYQMISPTAEADRDIPLQIGANALIRGGSILYAGSTIGKSFQTGHQVTVREQATIGDHVSIGTLSDIQGHCKIGNYVRLHSNVHIGHLSEIDDCVWIFPYVVLTNDPTPPSENLVGVHVHSFAIVSTNAILLPGVTVKSDALVGAGAIVSKDVEPYSVVVGNPAKPVSDVRKIKNKTTGEPVYPWRYYFDRNMPWAGSGFDTWYESLDAGMKRLLLGDTQ